MKSRMILGAVSSLVVLASTSQAGTISTSFAVLASVEPACTVVTATQLDFGNYTPSNFAFAMTPVDSTMTIEAQCGAGAGGSILLFFDDGLYPAVAGCPAVPSRRMAAVGLDSEGMPGVLPEAADTRLPYGIYFDAARTLPLGCAVNDNITGASIAAVTSLTFFGRIPAGANVVPGSYYDSVTVTVHF